MAADLSQYLCLPMAVLICMYFSLVQVALTSALFCSFRLLSTLEIIDTLRKNIKPQNSVALLSADSPLPNLTETCETAVDFACDTTMDFACDTAIDFASNTATDFACNTAIDVACDATIDFACNAAIDFACDTTIDFAYETAIDFTYETAIEYQIYQIAIQA